LVACCADEVGEPYQRVRLGVHGLSRRRPWKYFVSDKDTERALALFGLLEHLPVANQSSHRDTSVNNNSKEQRTGGLLNHGAHNMRTYLSAEVLHSDLDIIIRMLTIESISFISVFIQRHLLWQNLHHFNHLSEELILHEPKTFKSSY